MASHEQDGQQPPRPQVAVVMVPFPAQGHLNQLLHLSRLISSYDIPVHYVGAATHSRQAKLRVHGWDPLAATNIHFHEFSLPSFLSPPPDPNASIKFPFHLQPSFDASLHLRQPLANLLRTLSRTARRVVVVHDSMMASVVQDVSCIPNAESYTFHSVSAFAIFLYFWEVLRKPFPAEAQLPTDVPSLQDCFTPQFWEFIATQSGYDCFNSGNIYNSCKLVEGPYIDFLAREEISKSRNQWAMGPFNPVATASHKQRDECLEWLDEQAPRSVLYVSFGTTTTLRDEEIRELAIGLEQSEQRFIWVLRDADKGDLFVGGARKAMLPEGFEERVEGRGMVVRSWAPQLEILEHRATGGFMTHCGWNSCMESITMGVPMAAWPMHSDQPRNGVLVTQLLRVGLVVRDWARRHQLVTSSVVESAVRRLMESREGDEMRKRAAELGGAVRRSVAEGGASRMETDSFVAHITRL